MIRCCIRWTGAWLSSIAKTTLRFKIRRFLTYLKPVTCEPANLVAFFACGLKSCRKSYVSYFLQVHTLRKRRFLATNWRGTFAQDRYAMGERVFTVLTTRKTLTENLGLTDDNQIGPQNILAGYERC